MAERCGNCDEALALGAPWCEGCGAPVDDAPAIGVEDETAGYSVELPPDLSAYRRRLQETFGYPDFRGGQSSVLEGLAQGDVVAVMPTGSGKSLCYVLPALEVGKTLVVSPLIALMQDQVEGLNAAGVAATFINSNVDRDEQNRRYLDFIQGRTALLYVAPERFQNAKFTLGLKSAGINLLAIDEAHCISEWGHNFRPDYLQLGTVRERLGRPRTLALTATANPQVRRDIAMRLGIAGSAREVVTSVDRPNLTLNVQHIDRLGDRVAWLVEYARQRRGASGIVYARTRRSVEETAEALQVAGVDAEAYHAGLDRTHRSEVQRRFTMGETPVIVATNAFGMGIDKPDVRYVIHLNMPGRLEAYTQEAGRAGRDGEPSECTLLYARADRQSQQRFINDAHPSEEQVRVTWQRWVQVANPRTGRLPYDIGSDAGETYGMVVSALRGSRLLDPVALRIASDDLAAPIDMSSITSHREYAEARLREMAEYAETQSCRRAVIMRYFGETAPDECGRCDNCLGVGTTSPNEEPEYPLDLYDRLLEVREEIAAQGNREPYSVFENRTAREIATYRPRSVEALSAIWGLAEKRIAWFGRDLIALVTGWEREHPEAPPPPELPAQTRMARQGSSASRAIADDDVEVSPDDPLYQALREWRTRRARLDALPAYTVFSDRTLRALVRARPRNVHALLSVWGLGESRVERFGPELVQVIREHLS